MIWKLNSKRSAVHAFYVRAKENCEQSQVQLSGCTDGAVITINNKHFLFCPVHSIFWSSQGSRGIPLAGKICYAVGVVPHQITTVALAVSLQIFLLDVVQVIGAWHKEMTTDDDFQ